MNATDKTKNIIISCINSKNTSNSSFMIKQIKKYKKNAKTTATSIPMWSPTIVLTGPDVA